jgi:hypothetical protein
MATPTLTPVPVVYHRRNVWACCARLANRPPGPFPRKEQHPSSRAQCLSRIPRHTACTHTSSYSGARERSRTASQTPGADPVIGQLESFSGPYALKYPCTGILSSTPFGDLPPTPPHADNPCVDQKQLRETRKRRLRQWIDEKHAGKPARFAAAIKQPQPKVADVLDGRKAFGEKLARKWEELAQMPKRYLDDAPEGSETRFGIQVTQAALTLFSTWESLSLQDRIETERDILARAAKKDRAPRSPEPVVLRDKDSE